MATTENGATTMSMRLSDLNDEERCEILRQRKIAPSVIGRHVTPGGSIIHVVPKRPRITTSSSPPSSAKQVPSLASKNSESQAEDDDVIFLDERRPSPKKSKSNETTSSEPNAVEDETTNASSFLPAKADGVKTVDCERCGKCIPYFFGRGIDHHFAAYHDEPPVGLKEIPKDTGVSYEICIHCKLYYDPFCVKYHGDQCSKKAG